jgi:hypothetical protein
MAVSRNQNSEGAITYTINAMGQDAIAPGHFKGDWSAYSFKQGPAKDW